MQAIHLVDWPDALVTAQTDTTVQATLPQTLFTCPTCGQTLQRNGSVTTTLNDLPRGRSPMTLTLQAPRLRCPGRCALPSPWQDVRCAPVQGHQPGFTRRLWEHLFDQNLRGTPSSRLAVWSGVNVVALRSLMADATREVVARPRATTHLRRITHVGIDEVFWHGRVITVILDLATAQPIDLLPDREKDTLKAFLLEFRALHGGPAPVFVTDMWEDFRAVLRDVYGPALRQVSDRFHLQAKIGEDLRAAASSILPSSPLRPRQLRAVNRVFLAACAGRRATTEIEGLSPAQRRHLILVISLAMEAAAIWNSADRAEAEWHFREWRWERALVEHELHLVGLTARPFSRLEHLMLHWKAEVMAYFDDTLAIPLATGPCRPSTGRLEAANGKVRRLLLASQHGRRRPFRKGIHAEDEQDQFERLWVRVMHRLRATPSLRPRHTVQLRPALEPCACGQPVATLNVSWAPWGQVWDRPLGDAPVRAVVERAAVSCPACQRRWRLQPTLPGRMTPALRENLLAWRREGISLGELHRRTGVSLPVLRALSPQVTPGRVTEPPPLIGLLRWRWRGRDHWVITDPATRRLSDLVEVPENTAESADAALSQWFRYHPTVLRVMVGDLGWERHLPVHVEVLADRFTILNVVHRELRNTVGQVATSLTVAARRAPERRRLRYLYLANPQGVQRLEDRAQAAGLAARRKKLDRDFSALNSVSGHLDALRTLLETPPKDDKGKLMRTEAELRDGLQEWILVAARRSKAELSLPGGRGLHYGMADAADTLSYHLDAVVRGVVCQWNGGANLGASRQLLCKLSAHAAAGQADFSFLRASALVTLGGGP